MDQVVYNSSRQSGYLEIRAPYYNAIYPTMILFEEEQVSAFVNSLGHVEFYDSEGKSLGYADVPAAESPDLYAHSGQYGNAWYRSDGEQICIQLPVYEWDDYYPHCDGESDRWARREIRRFRVVFDCKARQIAVLDR